MKRFASLLILGWAMLLPLRAVNATPITFEATLLGSTEIPGSGSPGIGFATVVIDQTTNSMHVHETFSGLLSPTMASHIHCCLAQPATVGVATTVPTFPGFPLGVTSGTYDAIFDMTMASSYNPAFVATHGGTVAAAEAALFAGMIAGQSYINIHTHDFPGGEIRGILVPEPATLALFSGGLLVLGFLRRRRVS